ncbi:hypothetical protein CQA53_05065 [Helicobacter didelphidarum]|uniref:Uncharacterized protein n=1 Tax=Helicobacter didelphidarum TaxID=2040648 RepID=A0A3D8ILJ6_9HELI|nr:hypothetical protein [Helicobacter didelphidarum]RDU65993.1 hypothetical protein CQA53_05065 [Helicobacter didelphidarum]
MEYNERQLICSLATWRSLREQNKTQYDIIEAFCKNIITSHYSTISFSVQDIRKKIKIEYGFDKIPDSIFEQVLLQNLKKYLNKDKEGRYRLVKQIDTDNNIKDIIKKYIIEYKNFCDNLKDFLDEKKYKYPDNFLELFNHYLLLEEVDKNENKEIFAHFANFLLKYKERYYNLLQTIKEGIILYEGLRYGIKKVLFYMKD